jgi:PDZ domain-containing protein
MLPDPPPPLDEAGARRRRRMRLVALSVVVVVLAGLVTLAAHNAGQFYIFSPGNAPLLTADARCTGSSELRLPGGQPCVRIAVSRAAVHPIGGRLFMVDVYVGTASFGDYVLDELGLLGSLRNHSQLVRISSYTGNLTQAQVQCQDTAQMIGAQDDAPVAALRRLGYRVPEVDKGAVVDEVVPHTPAAAAGLRCNDVIVGFDGKPVHTAADLVADIRAAKPGQQVTIARRYAGPNGKRTQTSTVTARLGTTPPAVAGAQHVPATTAFLGVSAQSDVTFAMPVAVHIDAGNIGGPSAGLAFTLGVIDLLSGGHLTGGKSVAATGEIYPNGNVSEVGGVAQKTVAVEAAGATAFIVPTGDYAAARSAAGGKLRIYPVKTLDQALAVLKSLGGTVPPTNFASAHPLP